jgi:LIM homeobox transcription factor 1
MKVQNSYVYHVNCFVCSDCNKPLQKGEQFAFRAGQLICRNDLEKETFLPQTYDDDYVIEGRIRSRDGRRGPKRPRTILTSSQRRQFKASFDVSPKPCRKVREALAKDTGLSVRVVQVWFQNQVRLTLFNSELIPHSLIIFSESENQKGPKKIKIGQQRWKR